MPRRATFRPPGPALGRYSAALYRIADSHLQPSSFGPALSALRGTDHDFRASPRTVQRSSNALAHLSGRKRTKPSKIPPRRLLLFGPSLPRTRRYYWCVRSGRQHPDLPCAAFEYIGRGIMAIRLDRAVLPLAGKVILAHDQDHVVSHRNELVDCRRFMMGDPSFEYILIMVDDFLPPV